ncbi:MAG: hypothetical protein ABSG31_10325 [Tepidisphaeraceae bacterium]|jgi:hypothetical protein
MSMHVILDRVPSAANWQAAITAAGFNLALDPSLNTYTNTGYLPVRFDDIDSGFEFDVASVPDSAPTFLPFLKLNDTPKLSANFTWGGDILEMCCAFAAASALAKLSGGILFQSEDGTQYSGDEAIKAAKAEIVAADGMY